MKKAIYAGTFDPLTNGHFDVIERAARLFDEVVVGIGINPRKKPMFSLEDRIAMIRETIKGLSNVSVEGFEGLLVDFARRSKAGFIVRGLRLFADFENEWQMSMMNQKLAPEIESTYLMPRSQTAWISSSAVKEVYFSGGDVREMIPAPIFEWMKSLKGDK